MTKKVFNMQGGKHSVLAYSAFENRAWGSCVASAASFVVSIGTGMGLNISTGDGLISVDTTLARRIQIDAVETVTVSAASASYGRIDSVVAYIDTAVTPDTSTTDNANNILKFIVVAGTAASTPVAPTGAAIQSAIGAGKPYMILYNALIPQNAVNTSGVTLTDLRNVFTIQKTANIADLAITTGKLDQFLTSGWLDALETWTYASANTFTVVGNQTTKYTKGTRVKFTQTTVKYGTVINSTYSAPNTTVTLAPNNDFSITNAVISANYYSYQLNPQGYPGLFTYTPTVTADAGTPITVSVPSSFQVVGNVVFVTGVCTVTNKGTATGQIKLSVPVPLTKNGACNATEYALAGKSGKVDAQGSIIYISQYDGTTWWVNGYVFDYSVSYGY